MIMESTELVQKRQIEDIIRIRNKAVKDYGAVLNSLEGIKNELNSLGEYIMPNYAGHRGLLDVEGFSKELDKRLWRHCFDKLGVYSVMDAKSIEKLRKEIDDKTPALTEDNITATIQTMYENRSKYFVEGIINTFKRLSSDYWTNNHEKFKIPDRCIMEYIVEPNWTKGFRLRYGSEDQISDIDRTFHLLDKKPFEPRKTMCEINNKFKEGQVYGNEYFELKGYKNGNGHIKFKRIDLLDLANQMIADYYGNTLK